MALKSITLAREIKTYPFGKNFTNIMALKSITLAREIKTDANAVELHHFLSPEKHYSRKRD